MTDPTDVLSAELVAVASELVMPGGGAVAAPLLPAAERYAASQAAPSTRRTYRSTMRSFALFVETELGLPATVGALTLDTALDYSACCRNSTRTPTSRAAIRARSPSSSRRSGGSRAGWL
jgi:hypothetical protein